MRTTATPGNSPRTLAQLCSTLGGSSPTPKERLSAAHGSRLTPPRRPRKPCTRPGMPAHCATRQTGTCPTAAGPGWLSPRPEIVTVERLAPSPPPPRYFEPDERGCYDPPALSDESIPSIRRCGRRNDTQRSRRAAA